MARQVRRAVLVACLLSAVSTLLAAAVPLYAWYLIDVALPSGSIDTLVKLTVAAGSACLAVKLVELCRDRIVLRAGVWLDHVAGRHLMPDGVRQAGTADQLHQQRKALSDVAGLLSGRRCAGGLGPLLDLTWTPVLVLIMLAMDPVMGAAAAAIAAGLVLVAVTLARVTARSRAAGRRAATRADLAWRGLIQQAGAHEGADGTTVAEAAARCEALDRAHVAASYAAGKSSSAIAATVGMLGGVGRIALIGSGGWLMLAGELQPGVLVAVVLIFSRIVSALEQAMARLDAVHAARMGWRVLISGQPDVVAEAGSPRAGSSAKSSQTGWAAGDSGAAEIAIVGQRSRRRAA